MRRQSMPLASSASTNEGFSFVAAAVAICSSSARGVDGAEAHRVAVVAVDEALQRPVLA